MIRMTIINPRTGKRLLLLGLDRENVNRLTDGKPILVEGEPMNLPFDVSVVFGETLEEIRAELEKGGLRFPHKVPINDR
jgi:hypothetical protein